MAAADDRTVTRVIGSAGRRTRRRVTSPRRASRVVRSARYTAPVRWRASSRAPRSSTGRGTRRRRPSGSQPASASVSRRLTSGPSSGCTPSRLSPPRPSSRLVDAPSRTTRGSTSARSASVTISRSGSRISIRIANPTRPGRAGTTRTSRTRARSVGSRSGRPVGRRSGPISFSSGCAARLPARISSARANGTRSRPCGSAPRAIRFPSASRLAAISRQRDPQPTAAIEASRTTAAQPVRTPIARRGIGVELPTEVAGRCWQSTEQAAAPVRAITRVTRAGASG
jgi:hypothetical protein